MKPAGTAGSTGRIWGHGLTISFYVGLLLLAGCGKKEAEVTEIHVPVTVKVRRFAPGHHGPVGPIETQLEQAEVRQVHVAVRIKIAAGHGACVERGRGITHPVVRER